MKILHTKVLQASRAAGDDPAIIEAARLLREGQPVALPTETVYGLAADATSPEAAARVFEAKGRPRFDPLIVHLPSLEWLPRVTEIPRGAVRTAETLIERFWPGPLTLLLPRRDLIPDIVTSGSPLVAVRLSAHPVFRAVAVAANVPLAAPSANRFGRVSPTDAPAVVEELGGRIPLILDCGPARHGIESTIVEILREGTGVIRRPGPITAELLREVISLDAAENPAGVPDATPGSMESHYAPATPLRLFDRIMELPGPPVCRRIGVIFWEQPQKDHGDRGFDRAARWSDAEDLIEAAARLFRLLREFDAAGLDEIWAQRVSHEGIGVAINDRLTRAAGRRRAGD